jgi:hypothetical protein
MGGTGKDLRVSLTRRFVRNTVPPGESIEKGVVFVTDRLMELRERVVRGGEV